MNDVRHTVLAQIEAEIGGKLTATSEEHVLRLVGLAERHARAAAQCNEQHRQFVRRHRWFMWEQAACTLLLFMGLGFLFGVVFGAPPRLPVGHPLLYYSYIVFALAVGGLIGYSYGLFAGKRHRE